MNTKVNFYFEKEKKWKTEIELLRNLCLETNVIEDLKWGCPCYLINKKNVFLIHTFKEYCAILFFKGALMKNKENLLIQQTENVQAARQMRFTLAKEIIEKKQLILQYLNEAIEIENAGKKVELKTTKEYPIPDEFLIVMEKNIAVRTAFELLTPGRQRSYLFYFNSAKQSKTRTERIEKYLPKIIEGKGIDD